MEDLRMQRTKRAKPLLFRPKVIVESPYRGDLVRNKNYLRLCMYDSIVRGEAPSASHKLYTDVLNDDDPDERELGLELGFIWLKAADLVAFYVDFGFSPGMAACLRDIKTFRFRIRYEIRRISANVLDTIRPAGSETAYRVRDTPNILRP